MADLFSQIKDGLARQGRPSSDFDLNSDVVLPENRKITPAAVMVALFEGRDGVEMILTKRSPRLKHHPGQVAFPGGKQDPEDRDIVETAIREAREEIGLTSSNLEVLGTLAPHETVTGFSVTPVIARLERAFDPVIETGEVSEMFCVPLDHVLDTSNYLIEGRRWRGKTRRYYVVPYGPYYIWGATARMLMALAEQVKA